MKKVNRFLILILLFLAIVSNEAKAQDPLFLNSVVSNDIDFILDTDPDMYTNLRFIGRQNKEMPDSRSDILFDENAFVFEASFSNSETVEIWCHSSFITQDAAKEYAEKLCPRLGKLPSFQRDMLDHVVIHTGDETAFAESEAHLFVLYSDNMDARISTHDLEETVFHESVHAAIQSMYENDPTWTIAQSEDPTFVTKYAQDNPDSEDMAESALFAYTFIKHPGRLPEYIETWLMENIPNRLEFFGTIYSSQCANGACDCTSDLIINDNLLTSGTYGSTSTINSKAVINAGIAINFQAEQAIILEPDFHAKAGSDFTARIGTCSLSIIQAEIAVETINRTNTFTETKERTFLKKIELQVTPNPLIDKANIRFYLPIASDATIQISTTNGQLLTEKSITTTKGWNNTQLDASQLQNGLYYITLQTQKGKWVQKIMVLK